ncbi:hypothetical protein ACIA6C_28115 [Streptomyces sp. NPDC051578]|uniref:hypothetical protein n=1 Tax=Streptomyces sp. NPDC051578 TaxID=3365662 RepID=UPI0037A72BCB
MTGGGPIYWANHYAQQRERPTAEQPVRYIVATITSDVLDQLYARLVKAEQDAKDSITAAAHLTTLVGRRSERAEQAAKAERRRADTAQTELRTLRAGLRANGAEPTQLQNLWAQISLRNRQWRAAKQRAEQAEAVLVRVRAECDRIEAAVRDTPTSADLTGGYLAALRHIRAALDPQEPTP